MPKQQITHENIFRVLLLGFMLIILLLIAAASISVQSIRSIIENAADLVNQELVANRLIDDIQKEQVALSAVFLKLSRDPDVVDREKVLSELDAADKRMDEIGQSVAGTPEAPLWSELKRSSGAFSQEARRLLSDENASSLLSRDLFRRHLEALSIVARLAAANHNNASNARQEIDRRARELTERSALLLGACLLLALICAILTVRMVLDLIRRMDRQSSELSRVSWHMLENQETTARRFSHELHDELGQSLTALKANIHALDSRDGVERGRVEDCLCLIDEAISNVRELSQLLHPTILDDFGLDAAIRWLSERFTQRTGIEVDYRSDFDLRLPVETETHLFRICQEALTNVARHSQATGVQIRLHDRNGRLELSISDNGRGLPDGAAAEQQGLGLVGMRARARSAGGALRFRTGEGKGFTIDIEVPIRGNKNSEKDKNLVSG
jgi:signal transduction histidine kinase